MLEGGNRSVYKGRTVICIIEGPQSSTRFKPLLLDSTPPNLMSFIHLSAVLECDIFRKVDRLDYDSLHNRNKVVSLEMVAGHKIIDGADVVGAAAAVLGG